MRPWQVGKERYPRCSWQAGLFIGSQAALALALTALFSWQASLSQSLSQKLSLMPAQLL